MLTIIWVCQKNGTNGLAWCRFAKNLRFVKKCNSCKAQQSKVHEMRFACKELHALTATKETDDESGKLEDYIIEMFTLAFDDHPYNAFCYKNDLWICIFYWPIWAVKKWVNIWVNFMSIGSLFLYILLFSCYLYLEESCIW